MNRVKTISALGVFILANAAGAATVQYKVFSSPNSGMQCYRVTSDGIPFGNYVQPKQCKPTGYVAVNGANNEAQCFRVSAEGVAFGNPVEPKMCKTNNSLAARSENPSL